MATREGEAAGGSAPQNGGASSGQARAHGQHGPADTAPAQPRIEIRRATPDDLPRVSQLFGALHAFNATFDPAFALSDEWPTYLAEAFGRAHDQPDALWILAWDGAEAVGLLIAETHLEPPIFRRRHWLELSALFVQPSYRRYGVARQLADYLADWARTQGLDAIQLYVSAGNTGARDFYARQGYTVLQEIWRKRLEPGPAPAPDGAR
ncbi:MAG TPA: GNAT family N-acetyltransferase [Chloroflexota bacterium]|jgi:ribosomal protein S18 acetylase RimI-like enzyme